MGHDEKEVMNAALENAHVRVCRHQVVGMRYFPLTATENQNQKVPGSFPIRGVSMWR